jgi:hypothetical protein
MVTTAAGADHGLGGNLGTGNSTTHGDGHLFFLEIGHRLRDKAMKMMVLSQRLVKIPSVDYYHVSKSRQETNAGLVMTGIGSTGY